MTKSIRIPLTNHRVTVHTSQAGTRGRPRLDTVLVKTGTKPNADRTRPLDKRRKV